MHDALQPNAGRLPPGTCEHFATKGLYIASDDKARYEDRFEVGTSAFWCVLMQRPYGPDGLPVAPEACNKTRRCCTPRPIPQT